MKPSTLILDLLRTYSDRGADVKTIMETGELFSYSKNLMRVSLSRLLAKNVVEKIQRGQYRLCASTNPINTFTERWRLGEERTKPWLNSEWICVHTPEALSKRGDWVLNINGFRLVSKKLWIRPDNLAFEDSTPEEFLREMGLDQNTIFMNAAKLASTTADLWFAFFDTESLDKDYMYMQNKLEASLQNLSLLPIDTAKRESFHLGGEAITLLANDPLIPKQVHATTKQMKLWRTLKSYDQLGRKIWSHADSSLPQTTPTQSIQQSQVI